MSVASFRHDALLYTGTDDLIEQLLPFARDGLDAGDAVLVALEASKLTRLRAALGADAARVHFLDMHVIGRNPARILAAWQDFAAAEAAPGRTLRGVGEPLWPGRGIDELDECERHEALLNVAFADRDDFWLVCPYDVAALDDNAIACSYVTHPVVVEDGHPAPSSRYVADPDILDGALAEPVASPDVLAFASASLSDVRRLVVDRAEAVGVGPSRARELMFAVNEAATNSIRHGGGNGELRLWHDGRTLWYEVRDQGEIHDPFVGRRRPVPGQVGGYGLWLINGLADLTQIRSSPGRSVVRMRFAA
ncbi:MAG: sensor histidine kinase [Solirubrobacteraceae bacterium]|nr:sensor histidine kinase [Solirubrobacteraceae bacterium]